ncbi:hypothetical protein EGW08_019188 [Elysia chlorotica]|uniref:RING-type domain-containing protein n=1 Tax=Elysia chlorotica TaxID=188477 RepID=A0A3S0ZEB4_ELYCH|nr:hypothetical protein EGW08_019188 [Elysia chlorotica]
MSTFNLRAQIRQDHLTCSICFSSFIKPKALPCIHTFCLACLQDYIFGRGYHSGGSFPCPVCRAETHIPPAGIDEFPDNHIMSSLSDTVENSGPPRPVPKPRRSLLGDGAQPMPQESDGADALPSYSSVADTDPTLAKVCSNDNEPDWMVVPRREPSAPQENVDDNQVEYCVVSVSQPQVTHRSSSVDPPPGSINTYPGNRDFNTNTVDSTVAAPVCPLIELQPSGPPSYQTVCGPQVTPQPHGPAGPIGWNIPHQMPTDPHSLSSVSYPTVPPFNELNNVACTENLMLRFGKQGSSVRDFIKPVGLTVSSDGSYIISDNGGDQNRIFIYDSSGEIKSAFKCGCKVKDIAIRSNDDILAAVHKSMSAVRLFSLAGQCKAEYGKFFTYEEPSGIAELTNGGLVVTGTANNCIYVLTNQMKLSLKFGRKGNGDGYFLHPGHVATDSKNHIIVSDKTNNTVQVFGPDGKFKHRFGSAGTKNGQLQSPLGVCVDNQGNIIVADSGNHRVEVFTSKGRWLSRIVSGTQELGEQVRPVNVAWTPTGKVAVLLRGPYFAEVRVYSTRHRDIPQNDNPPHRFIGPCW